MLLQRPSYVERNLLSSLKNGLMCGIKKKKKFCIGPRFETETRTLK